jgi:hypothetical protein
MATRDYSSIYNVKDFIQKNIAPKYFDLGDVNLLNIGMIGYTTDILATMGEDSFNTVSTYTKEIFPNLAEIPETIYNNAARFQIDKIFAKPSTLPIMLFINESDIHKYAKPIGDRSEFILDSALVVNIEDIPFMLDYDIRITVKPYRGDFNYAVTYKMDFTNSLSTSTNPYIRFRRVTIEGQKYLGLLVDVHQVSRFEQNETIINNDKINYPTLQFQFNNQIANFEVFYRAPGASSYVQLKKRLINSTAILDPFCYYRVYDEDRIEISFNIQDNYFQPEFNSDIMFRIYTTQGKKGNFPTYKGDNIIVSAMSDTEEYSNNIVLFAQARNASIGGYDMLTLEQLRTMVIELASTTGAYTTENDLQLYFSNNSNLENTDVLFIKRRDDALERLFSAFSLFKDMNEDIYPTNTLNLKIDESQFDNHFEQTNRYLLKPGHIFTYIDGSTDMVQIKNGLTLKSDLKTVTDPFVYTSPYMISVSKTQGIVGFYLNTWDVSIPLEYTAVNEDSPIQFIFTNMHITRNALQGEDYYTMRITLTPAVEDEIHVKNADGTFNDNMVIKGFIQDTSGVEISYIDFQPVSYDDKLRVFIFEAKLTTDDYMTLDEKMRVSGVKDIETGIAGEKLIPMVDAVINFSVFYKHDGITRIPHKYDYLDELKTYTLTNQYSSSESKITFIKPINMMRSRFKYIQSGDSYYMTMSLLPFVKATTMQNETMSSKFVEALYEQYTYLNGVLDRITSNFGVDMKFYNTYGKSKHFLIGDGETILNRVNCSFRSKVTLNVGTIESEVVADLKQFVKDYIETLNKKNGYNSVFVSNLYRAILEKFEAQVSHLNFTSINGYPADVQTIRNRGVDIETLPIAEIRTYVPEYLTITVDDVIFDVTSN